MAARRVLGLFRCVGSGWSVGGFASASASGYSRKTVSIPTDYPSEGIPFRHEDFGTDYKHWFVSVKEPVVGTREEKVAHYVKIMTDFMGNDEEAALKKMYMVSTRCYYAFGALISGEEAERLEKMPHVKAVIPDAYVNRETKDYGGEPFIDGQLVPYDPKYHKFFDDLWAQDKAREEAEDRALAEAIAMGDISDESDDDDDDGRISTEYRKRLKKIQGFSRGTMS